MMPDYSTLVSKITQRPPPGGTGESPSARRMVIPPPIDPAKIIEQLNQIALTLSGHRRVLCSTQAAEIDRLIISIGDTARVVAQQACNPMVEAVQ